MCLQCFICFHMPMILFLLCTCLISLVESRFVGFTYAGRSSAGPQASSNQATVAFWCHRVLCPVKFTAHRLRTDGSEEVPPLQKEMVASHVLSKCKTLSCSWLKAFLPAWFPTYQMKRLNFNRHVLQNSSSRFGTVFYSGCSWVAWIRAPNFRAKPRRSFRPCPRAVFGPQRLCCRTF